ncbi:beta-Ig-H3/Fasciclin [Plectosphaerella plurivora]|uniref:Beta-Ig-H3/Fasciclin n=1 Tax=Plectosphaerella plurivora TaxID=936078 RepID=A0A9P9AGR4_9PEZI|nr:beta-Ig-H3/Fasciclin [Plectosphaerella plurivora]
MKSFSLAAFALSALVAAQDSTPPSLTEVLEANQEQLSQLSSLLTSQPDLVAALATQTNITILAPNNAALAELLTDADLVSQIAADSSIVAALLQYHVISGAYFAGDFTETPQFLETLLSNDTYEDVEGGQVVEGVAADGSVVFYSGLKLNSTVVQGDVEFEGGVIHIIDSVLTIPQDVVTTATAANLTSLIAAVTQANLGETLTDAESITVFAPTNEAFAALGSLDGVTEEDLASILTYHVVAGTVAYSSTLQDGTVETLNGESLQISIRDGSVFVNDAQVVVADVLISNGVVHVIDGVLNPESASPSASASVSGPAPSSTPSEVPQAGAAHATAGLAVGAIMAGAALFLNF